MSKRRIHPKLTEETVELSRIYRPDPVQRYSVIEEVHAYLHGADLLHVDAARRARDVLGPTATKHFIEGHEELPQHGHTSKKKE